MTPTPATPPSELFRLMVREGRRRIVVLAAVFAAVAIGALVVGVVLPKRYQTHAVILVEDKNIITPLMAGRAVATDAADQASILSQAMQSRRILREVMSFGGWPDVEDPRAQERAIARLSARIRIAKVRPELVRISFLDEDPKRCLAVTKKLAEIYVRESMAAKSRQSGEAYEFIDRQVTEYAAKVAEAHAAVQDHYRRHGTAKPQPARVPEADRQRGPRVSPEELAALRADEAALAAKLASGELRQGRQRRADRVEQLRRELESLLGTYTERHPNVRRAREQLQIAEEEAQRAAAEEELGERAARARLDEIRGRLAAASGAGARGRAEPPPAAAAPELRVVAEDSVLTELVRRYESARDVYQDMLKRRENARVSMDLDSEDRGLTVRVYEEPELPLVPVGMRLMHFTAIGVVLAVAVPLGLLFAFVRLDPRVRSPLQIERLARTTVLVTIPYARTSQGQAVARRRVVYAVVVVAAVLATYAVFLVVRVVLSR
ncbi:MAG TPA: Wzz/FepE/Etk N-terminal domain-containing protein [Candidatus Limnocylindria bacterium]|nr:Wzz/FepE/Etk N-terminal domain-containing protein [Candidatus Limnocylindria bacterium]